MIGEGRPLVRENLAHTDPPGFRSIFVRSTSAVTPSEKSLCAFQSAQDEHHTLYLTPKGRRGLKNAMCPKFEQ